MQMNMIKCCGLGALIALSMVGAPAYSAFCGTSTGLGAVFSVLGDGVINLHNDGENGQCNPAFFNASMVNANSGNLVMSGTDANGKNCQAYASAEDVASRKSKSLSASGKSISGRLLPDYQQSQSDFSLSFPTGSQVRFGDDLNGSENTNENREYVLSRSSREIKIVKSGSVYRIPGGDYGRIEIQNGVSLVFDGPARVKSLSMSGCNGAGVTFAQDGVDGKQTYVNEISWPAQCNVSVSGPGVTTLNVLGMSASGSVVGLSLSGGPTCVNYADCAAEKTWTNMDMQRPDRLQINVYNGNFQTQGNFSLAAGVYVGAGDFNMGNGTPVTIVGEILARNVFAQNNAGTKFFSKSTAQAILQGAPYSLTPPAVDAVTKTGDYVFRAMQSDYRADGTTPGTSGDLKAFRLKSDSSQDQTPVWSAAEAVAGKMLPANRASKIVTERELWGGVSGDFETLSTEASGATLAQACAIDPTRSACRVPNDPRDPTSMVGVPWRVAPLIVGDSVLFATDDGILYSVDKSNGNLNWGWVPREVLALSQAGLAATPQRLMQDKHPWGQIALVQVLEDVTDSEGRVSKQIKSYLTGTALGGQLHFSIEVASDGKELKRVVWLDYRQGGYSPGSAVAGWPGLPGRPYGGQAPVQAVNGSGKVAYLVGTNLVTRKVNAADTPTVAVIGSGGLVEVGGATNAPSPTSTLLYVNDESLYFGALDGKVYEINSSGVITKNTTSVDKVSTGDSGAVWYVNGARISSASGNGLMLLAQTERLVTAMKRFDDQWSVAWRTGFNADHTPYSGEGSTTAKINVTASDKAFLSAPASIKSGAVILFYTKAPDECNVSAWTFGPIKLQDGTSAIDGAEFRLTSMTAMDNEIGGGESTGSSDTVFEGKQGFMAGGSGDQAGGAKPPETAFISPRSGRLNDRLNWRELTNFF